VATAVALSVPLAFLGHGLGGVQLLGCSNAVISLFLGLCVAIASWRITPGMPAPSPKTFWDWLMIGIFACASARAFFWLLYEDGDEFKILSPDNLGDMSLHLSFIHWLAATTHWWPASPILAGDPLRYPPGSDLFNALLEVAGVPTLIGLLWCALGGAALTGYALWRWGGAIALAALLFNGGVAGIVLWKGGDPDAVSEWKNLFLTIFVTQRAFLFALPAGLLLLTAWREESFGSPGRVVLPLPVQVLLLGVMPLFSIHTALYLGVAMVGIGLAARERRSRLVRLALFAWPVMALLGWLVATGGGGPSPVHALGWQLGWMSDGTATFWFWNFGIVLPLALLLCFMLLKERAFLSFREAHAFVWPAVIIFVLCLLVRFAPWAWDNMKLMLWSWIVIVPYLWSVLLERRHLVIRVAAVILLFGSGAATLEAGLDGRHGYELIKRSTLARTGWELRDVPSNAVIACAPEYNHPVLILGHPVVAGYEGHLWSHGLDYHDRLAALNSVMMGEPGWREKALALGASFIYWSDLESTRWPDSKLPWAHDPTPSLHSLETR
jgi:hypothetical protein